LHSLQPYAASATQIDPDRAPGLSRQGFPVGWRRAKHGFEQFLVARPIPKRNRPTSRKDDHQRKAFTEHSFQKARTSKTLNLFGKMTITKK
jgi:hypothetical protein